MFCSGTFLFIKLRSSVEELWQTLTSLQEFPNTRSFNYNINASIRAYSSKHSSALSSLQAFCPNHFNNACSLINGTPYQLSWSFLARLQRLYVKRSSVELLSRQHTAWIVERFNCAVICVLKQSGDPMQASKVRCCDIWQVKASGQAPILWFILCVLCAANMPNFCSLEAEAG